MQWAIEFVTIAYAAWHLSRPSTSLIQKFESMYMSVQQCIHVMDGYSIRQRDLNQVMKEFKVREQNEIMEALIAPGRLVEVNIPTKRRSAKGLIAV